MKNLSIRQRIMASFAAILAIMALMGALAFSYLQNIEQDAKNLELDSVPGTIYSAQLRASVLNNYALNQRYFFLDNMAEREKILERIKEGRERQKQLLEKYDSTIFRAEDRAMFNKIESALNYYWGVLDRFMKLAVERGVEDLTPAMLAEADLEYKKMYAKLHEMVDYNEQFNLRSAKEIRESSDRARTVILGSFVIGIGLALVLGVYLLRAINGPLQQLLSALEVMRQGDFTVRMDSERRDEFGTVAEGFNRMNDELTAIVGQVQKSGIQVTTSMTEISAISKQQQTTATEVAATTVEIGATSKEISATSRQLVKTMSDVSAVAEQSAILAGSGHVGLGHMEEAMNNVMEATRAINNKLSALNEKAGNINQVITTISKVAEQTNLLSLNAAIEAAKAGEHGRGFSVVATEIRRLADQTAVASYDIGQTVKEMQAAVSSSVMGMDKFSEEVRRSIGEVQHVSSKLAQIIEHVQTLAPRFEDVNEGMQAQAVSAEQITQALAQLNESASQTVESLRQSTMAIDELHLVANGLRGGVSRFKLRQMA